MLYYVDLHYITHYMYIYIYIYIYRFICLYYITLYYMTGRGRDGAVGGADLPLAPRQDAGGHRRKYEKQKITILNEYHNANWVYF